MRYTHSYNKQSNRNNLPVKVDKEHAFSEVGQEEVCFIK